MTGWVAFGIAMVLAPAAVAGRAITVEVDAPRVDGAQGRCEVLVGLDLGDRGLMGARRVGAMATVARVWLGEDLALPEGLVVTHDGRYLEVLEAGPCEPTLARQLRRLSATRELALPLPYPALERPRAWATQPALRPLVEAEPFLRALAAGLGVAEPTASDEQILEMLAEAMRDSDARLRVVGAVSMTHLTRRLPRGFELAADTGASPRLEPRTVLLPSVDGQSRFVILWPIERPDDGRFLAHLAGHPGFLLGQRLVRDHALLDRLEARWLDGPRLLALSGVVAGPGARAGLERLLTELDHLGRVPLTDARLLEGAALLAREGPRPMLARTPRSVSRLFAEALAPDLALIAVEPMRPDPDGAVAIIDAELVASWTAAAMSLRCPSPDDGRERNRILAEDHGLDAQRYLAISRAMGRDPERMRLIDRELQDRCAEDEKLRKLVPTRRIATLHREILCGRPEGAHADDQAEQLRRRAIYRRHGVDSSMHRPLVAMAKRSPSQRDELMAIERRCPESP